MDESQYEGARFSPHRTSEKSYCCVFGCSSKGSRDWTVRFHRFPRPGKDFVNITNKFGKSEKIDRLEAWIAAIKFEKTVTLSMRICSLHFTKNDYLLPDIQTSKRILKRTAVPSCNLPKRSKDKEPNSKEIKNGKKRQLDREKKKLDTKKIKVRRIENPLVNDAQNSTDGIVITDTHMETETELNVLSVGFSTSDISIQVQNGDLIPTLRIFIKTDRQLSTLTGIQSFKILNLIVNRVHVLKPHLAKSKSTLEEHILMTYLKLKQNASFTLLAILCHTYNAQSCKRIFYKMLKVLSQCLKAAIPWPSEAEISRNVPKCFQEIENPRVMLDFREISLQKPKDLCCQILTYSFYKSAYTVKFMIGVTPSGLVSFISKPYGGRASDKDIFEESKLMEKLQRKDSAMVDKDFLIDDICKRNDLNVIRPPFLERQKQFSASEAILTAKTATGRFQVERANKRLKTFKILGDRLPAHLVTKIGQIFTIICGTVNLSASILKDDKF